jgi:ketosteroid isomerase-like protein
MLRLSLLATLLCSGCAAPTTATFREILDRQAVAWNRGDIDAFMNDYWNSDDLTFSSGGQTRHGWKTTRDRYRTRYPTKAEMGTLRFTLDETQPLSPSAALVLGQWDLDRSAGPIGGNFSLIFRRIDGRWVIVHDHTSLREPPPTASPATSTEQSVTAGCAMCVFHMRDVSDCVLALRIDGRDYLVDGRGIDEFGDAHARDGLCKTARPAIAQGRVRDGKYIATELRLAR